MELASIVSEESAVNNLRRKPTASEAERGRIEDEEEDLVPKQSIRVPVSIPLLNQLARLAGSSAGAHLDEAKLATLHHLLDELAEAHCRSRNHVFDFDLSDFTEVFNSSFIVH